MFYLQQLPQHLLVRFVVRYIYRQLRADWTFIKLASYFRIINFVWRFNCVFAEANNVTANASNVVKQFSEDFDFRQ